MIDGLQLVVGKAEENLKGLPPNTVHLCVTSPPYDNLRTYGGHATWDFEVTASELFRVMVPGGVVCWNIGDAVIKGGETLSSMRQAIHFVDKVGFRMHDTMIWNKLNFSHPAHTRYHQVFEYVFILSKGKPRVFNPIKDKKNAQAGMIGCRGKNTYAKRDGSRSTRTTYVTQAFGMRGNVWRGPTRGQEEFCRKLPHPAMMPRWLARDLIKSWSNPGDTVLDPFGGSGTTAEVAINHGRRAILFELNPAYIELIRERVLAHNQLFTQPK